MSGGPKMHRPNFDRLTREEIEFTHAYTTYHLCDPARCTIIKGLSPHNHLELMNETNYPFETRTYLELLVKINNKKIHFF